MSPETQPGFPIDPFILRTQAEHLVRINVCTIVLIQAKHVYTLGQVADRSQQRHFNDVSSLWSLLSSTFCSSVQRFTDSPFRLVESQGSIDMFDSRTWTPDKGDKTVDIVTLKFRHKESLVSALRLVKCNNKRIKSTMVSFDHK